MRNRRKMLLLLAKKKSGGGSIWQQITGSPPLTLLNAKNSIFGKIKQYGKCTQASTPTPSSPVDIVCNNGVIKVKHQSGLPVECALLESIESTGTQYIETGIYLDYGKDIRITGTIVNKTAGKRKIIIGNYNVANNMSMSLEFAGAGQSGLTSDGIRVYFGIKTGPTISAPIYSKSTAELPLNTDIDFDFVYIAKTSSFTLTCIANGQTYTLSDIIPDMFDGVSDETMTLFLDKRADPSVIRNSLTIKAMSITNDATAKEYVSVKKGDNVGMYDTVGGAFYANAGTSAFVGGSSVADPLTIYTVGTPEVLTVTHADSTTETAGAKNLYSIPSTDYADTQEIIGGTVTRNTGVLILDGTEEFADNSVLTNCYTLAIPLGNGPMTNRRVVCTHFKSSDTLPDANARQGYALIGNGGSTTDPPLTNKYAVAFGAKTAYPSIASFKKFLAAQYASGTPVIVVYPLAEPTTETATPQPLTTTKGTNVVDVTSNVDPVELDISYKARST